MSQGNNSSETITNDPENKSSLTLTQRFTQEEKEILYSLFHEHEEVIDIKCRKKSRNKYSVREAWEQIVREFNSHPGISAMRNMKQIQKFWLNARLRKQYPSRHSGSQKSSNSNSSGGGNSQTTIITHTIKDEPAEFQLSAAEASEQNESEQFEEMEMDAAGDTELEDPIETSNQEQHHIQHVQHQQSNSIQQISVDQISAEKLTLNDLLHFKTTRPREEIILQIKHPDAPTQITIPSHHQQQPQQHTMATITASGYNQQIISEIKPQQITLAQYQAQQQQQLQQQQLQQQQQQLAQQQLAAVAQQQAHQQQQQQVKLQLQASPAQTTQYATSTPTFTCTTFNAVPTITAPQQTTITTGGATLTAPAASNNSVVTDSYEEKISYFKLKESELRFKEQQLALEKKRIELNRAQDELKHMREVQRLQIEELKLKIRILTEEEKVLRKNQSSLA